MPVTTEGSFVNAEGINIFTQTWLPEGPPVAAVLWCHGLHDSSGRGAHVYKALVARGVAVYAWDFVGHGQSGGREHQFPHGFAGVVADAIQYATWIRAQQGDALPLFLAGASLGGLVAAHMTLEEPEMFAGAVFIAPAIDVQWTIVLHVIARISAFLAWLMPHARIVPAAPLSTLTENPQVLANLVADPTFIIKQARAKVGYECLRAFRSLKKRNAEVITPLLVMHGELDACTDNRASAKFVEAARSADKEFVMLPGMYHMCLEEPGAEKVLARMTDFVVSRATAAAAATTVVANRL